MRRRILVWVSPSKSAPVELAADAGKHRLIWIARTTPAIRGIGVRIGLGIDAVFNLKSSTKSTKIACMSPACPAVQRWRR
jgi:hypothetical protein